MAQTSSDAGWGAVAGAAANSAGQIAIDSARSAKQWKYQQKSLALQQKLNKQTWDMQNAYNTPQAQMQRLQEAGLNPRLVYGDASGPGNMSGPLDTAPAPTREAVGGKMPDLLTYYQIRQADAQYKQTTMATDIMEKTAGLKDIEMALNNLKLLKEKEFAPNYQLHAIMANDLETWTSRRAKVLLENEQLKGENFLRQGELMDQLKTFRSKQISGVDLDNAFKQHRNELAKLGIYSHDHPAFRMLIQASKRMNIDLGELLLEGAENLKYLLNFRKD